MNEILSPSPSMADGHELFEGEFEEQVSLPEHSSKTGFLRKAADQLLAGPSQVAGRLLGSTNASAEKPSKMQGIRRHLHHRPRPNRESPSSSGEGGELGAEHLDVDGGEREASCMSCLPFSGSPPGSPAAASESRRGRKLGNLLQHFRYRHTPIAKLLKKEREELAEGLQSGMPPLGAPTGSRTLSEAEHQDNARRNAELLLTHDLFVSVVRAHEIRAADSNGSSDPYCAVALGPHRHTTRPLQATLHPSWHETFAFPLDQAAACLASEAPFLEFEVWDEDGLLADDFLGQAMLDLTRLELQVGNGGSPLWLPLRAYKHGEAVAAALGQLEVAVWLAPSSNSGSNYNTDDEASSSGAAQGRGPSNQQQRVRLSRMPPPGPARPIPAVVHVGGGATLYEVPMIAFLNLTLCEVREVALDRSSPAAGKAPQLPAGTTSIRRRLLNRLHSPSKRPEGSGPSSGEISSSSMREISGSGGGSGGPGGSGGNGGGGRRWLRRHGGGEGGGGDVEAFEVAKETEDVSPSFFRKTMSRSESEVEEAEEEEDELDPWDWDGFFADDRDMKMEPESRRRTLEALQSIPEGPSTPRSSDDAAPPSPKAPGDGKIQFYYFKVALGSQSYTSQLALVVHGRAVWQRSFVFAGQLPLKDRPLRLELWRTASRKNRGRMLAHCTPLLSDFATSEAEADDTSPRSNGGAKFSGEPQWFALHSDAPSVEPGAVQLALAVVDSDSRREIYGMPVMAALSGRAKPEGGAAEGSNVGPSWAENLRVDSASSVSSRDALQEFMRDYAGAADGAAENVNTLATPPLTRFAISVRSNVEARTGWVLQKLGRRKQPDRRESQQEAEGVAEGSRRGGGRPPGGDISPTGAPAAPRETRRPLGMLKIVLHSMDVPVAHGEGAFCLMRCGVHWLRTPLLNPPLEWRWGAYLPIYEPTELLLLAAFSAPAADASRLRGVFASASQMLGKLRVRLSTLSPGQEYRQVELPLLATRKAGGGKTGTAIISIKVHYWDQPALWRRYLQPPWPAEVYRYGLQDGDKGRRLHKEARRLTLRWLAAASPPVPQAAALALLDTERDEFTMSRARANWQRLQHMLSGFRAASGWLHRVQRWERPLESASVVACQAAFAFYPYAMLCLALCVLVAVVMTQHHHRPEAPQAMEPDPDPQPEDEGDDAELATGGSGRPYARLRARYDALQVKALLAQNIVDDLAGFLERWQALVTWVDPLASAIFVFLLMLAALLISTLGLPACAALASAYMIRPPFLRTPTPPAPASFFRRLPTRADQIV